ncbi:MAG: hypothetical protein Q8L87_07220 [Anaerolineales bacterium]|jgi:hypothetical protein|nr:hypothetical protein [Anaerolineales bacterium]
MATSNQNGNGKKKRDVKIEFTISPVLQQVEKKISEAQNIQLEVIAKTNFNFFNGREIAAWLRENHRMWRAVMLPLDFISLRDMANGNWHADTLYIYPEDGYHFKLEEIMKEQFHADETQWFGGESAMGMLGTSEIKDASYVILSAWWD